MNYSFVFFAAIMIFSIVSTGMALASNNELHQTGWGGRTSITDVERDLKIIKFCADFVPYHYQGVDCQSLVNSIEIIEQNKIIISNQEKIIDLLENP